MKRLCFSVVLFIMMCSPGMAQEDSPAVLGTFTIPKMVESEEKGLFIDVVREIETRIGQQFTIKILSPKRTIKAFEDGEIFGFFPGTEGRVRQIKNVVTSLVFYVKRDLIFSKKGVSLTSIEALEGKKVGVTSGYIYAQELMSNPNITFVKSDSDAISMKNLAIGRLDAFVVEEFSGLTALEDCDCADDVTYDPTAVIASQAVSFAFQATEQGRALAEEFSMAIREMKHDGSLQRILGVSEAWVEMLPE